MDVGRGQLPHHRSPFRGIGTFGGERGDHHDVPSQPAVVDRHIEQALISGPAYRPSELLVVQIAVRPDQHGQLRHQGIRCQVLVQHNSSGPNCQLSAESALSTAGSAGHHENRVRTCLPVAHSHDCAPEVLDNRRDRRAT